MKMLITLDGSRFAESILEKAAELAASSNAEVHLIRVVDPSIESTTAPPPSSGEGQGQAQDEQQLRQEADDYLATVAERFFPQSAHREVVTGDDPAKEILTYYRREGMDLIAIATHGRTGQSRSLIGSVAGELIRTHAVPLFMIRPDTP